MSCENYTPECEARDCIECDTNVCEVADDCMEFNPESCIGAGKSKCDAFFSREEATRIALPNETLEEYLEHEDI